MVFPARRGNLFICGQHCYGWQGKISEWHRLIWIFATYLPHGLIADFWFFVILAGKVQPIFLKRLLLMRRFTPLVHGMICGGALNLRIAVALLFFIQPCLMNL